jgi:DNA replication protein DnaC
MATGHVGVEYVEYFLRHKRRLVPKPQPLRLHPDLEGVRLPEPDLTVYDLAPAAKALVAQATKENLSALDVAHRLADEEKTSRIRSAVARRISAARFPEINTVDAFDFDFSGCRKKIRARYLGLHDPAFLQKGINPLFIGVPGSGKTFLARALAYKACQATKRVVVVPAPKMLNELHAAEIHGHLERVARRFARADLLVIDDFAVLTMDAAQATLAFQIISERYDYR